ncbi:bile acid:sodium symporter family protein [Aquabacterium parvum]|uniref:bile acid:sodium symporter family protein n=1 Tax=Aquabacterium parvum TaxID=70584 RepID=UPI000718C491|nr:bile acid:sodium symporter family protein [Aquabacterium parvum]MBU0914895.1 bile acid:sodium symporter family protein [Gammaproteobacteria bacterium]
MQGDVVSSVLLPLILAFIMFSLGLGLTVGDFRRILVQPRALLVGVFSHFVLLPLVCFGMLKLMGLSGAFAVGFMILAACPTGATSNLLTYLARGDVALALGFTAIASLLTIFTLPVIVTGALAHFMGTERAVNVPVGLMMGQVALVMGLPVTLGMVARHRWTDWALRFEPRATRIATGLFVLIVVLAVIKNWPMVQAHFASLAPLALVLNLTMLSLGFAVAWLARLSRSQSITLGIETAVQNAALALVIASTVLQDGTMAIPGALYGVLMYVGGLLFAWVMRRHVAASEAAGEPHRATHSR